MSLAVSPISQNNFAGSVYEPKVPNKIENEGIQKIAAVDAKSNQQIPKDKFTSTNTSGNNSENKSNESYNAAGQKTTLDKSKEFSVLNKTDINKPTGTKEEPKSDEKREITELQKRDRQVRAHENAHKAVGGNLVKGGAHFTYTTGPDGKQYATGGEVQIDISPVKDDPEATIQKMNQVRAAALAPADPSPQDRSVAALASSIAANARAEASKQKIENKNTSATQKENLVKSYRNNDMINQSTEQTSQFGIYAGSTASLKNLK